MISQAEKSRILTERIAELEDALAPFVRIARVMTEMPLDFQSGPIKNDTPARDFLPRAWPVWADFVRAAEAMRGKELP